MFTFLLNKLYECIIIKILFLLLLFIFICDIISFWNDMSVSN